MARQAAETRQPPRSFLAERASATLAHFLHIEAVSGVVLLLSAATALLWANSPLSSSYEALWHMDLSLGLGQWSVSRSLHFWINDGLMTIFFLVAGMEIRREIHEGALSSPGQATLPLAAAAGGVIVPALIFLAVSRGPLLRDGWAVPTATDIAFAVGLLALLGRRVPANVRVILLALAVVDDLIAVLIIAIFYSGGLAPAGLIAAGAGVVMVAGLQRAGARSSWAYVLPGAVIWAGLLYAGIHPTLTGVILGLMTPVRSIWRREPPQQVASRIAQDLGSQEFHPIRDARRLSDPLRGLAEATREVLPPVVRVQMTLHPWVAYAVMPIFALANAGVALDANALSGNGAMGIMAGVAIALVLGKPVGILAAAWVVCRTGLCRLPEGVNWPGLMLIGLLAGIGFTMSIFIAMLAYPDAQLLSAAKLGVLLGSAVAAFLGLGWGALYYWRPRARLQA